MVWIYVAVGVGVIGLISLGWFVFVLYRRAVAVLAELAVSVEHAAQLLDLVAQVEIPDRRGGRFDAGFAVEHEVG